MTDEQKCPQCEGRGDVSCGSRDVRDLGLCSIFWDAWKSCPTCRGTGRIPAEPKEADNAR